MDLLAHNFVKETFSVISTNGHLVHASLVWEGTFVLVLWDRLSSSILSITPEDNFEPEYDWGSLSEILDNIISGTEG